MKESPMANGWRCRAPSADGQHSALPTETNALLCDRATFIARRESWSADKSIR
jgi:hypothetical protein